MWIILQDNADCDCFKDSDCAGDLDDLKSTQFWRNIVHFWKPYICSNKFDVQETNFSFTRFNEIPNHLFGPLIEIRRDSCSRFYGIWLFLFLETRFKLLRALGDPLLKTKVKNLKGRPTCWIPSIVLPQTSSLRIKNLRCMCSKTTKQWSRWLLKKGASQWDMLLGPTELRLIGFSIESTWTQKSKSSTSIPKTNLPTF